MFKRILVAIDIGEPALTAPAIAAVAEMARAGAEVRLVHVRYMIEAALPYLPTGFFASEEERIRGALEALAEGLGLAPGKTSVATPLGTVYDQVLAEAEEYGADLIVVGSRRPSASTYLIGSNAAKIVRHAKCSVLVIR